MHHINTVYNSYYCKAKIQPQISSIKKENPFQEHQVKVKNRTFEGTGAPKSNSGQEHSKKFCMNPGINNVFVDKYYKLS